MNGHAVRTASESVSQAAAATVRSQAEAGEVMTTWLPIIGGMFVLGITLLWIAARRN
jgi:hypothetical protein